MSRTLGCTQMVRERASLGGESKQGLTGKANFSACVTAGGHDHTPSLMVP